MSTKPAHIVVIGTSAGGLRALSALVPQLAPGMDIAVFIVMHLSEGGNADFLIRKLQPLSSFTFNRVTSDLPIEKNNIYVASSDSHMIVKEDKVTIGLGPSENRWKPAIDVLFRTAAASWSNRVTGIILTGLLDDGAVGMLAVKRSGGKAIIQDPEEAEYPSMPLAVEELVAADHILFLKDMGTAIETIVSHVPAKTPAPSYIVSEAAIAEAVIINNDVLELLGTKSELACPDCGGGLYSINEPGGHQRFRCHVGHAYTEKALNLRQSEMLESTLWVALRMMEERKTLIKRLAKNNYNERLNTSYAKKAEELEIHIQYMKNLLFGINKPNGGE